MKHIDKPWGWEEILETNPKYTVKRLLMKNGCQCSYQYHNIKQETIIVLSGDLTILGEGAPIILKPGESVTIPPKQKHRMRAESGDCIYMECSTSELDDVVRLVDDYGREGTTKA